MTKKGILTVISGFSGAGKGTIVHELVDRYGYAVSISATTRDPRAGETWRGRWKSIFFQERGRI